MKKYIINLTFFAGSDDPVDTDRNIYVLESSKELSQSEIYSIFREANENCNRSLYEDERDIEFPSYEEGNNIDTLVKGVSVLIEDYAKIYPFNEIAAVIDIEQWQ